MQKKIVVIGGGPAGLAAAKEVARLGGAVVLVEQDRSGGRALWHSLVPSKIWLSAANSLEEIALQAGNFTLSVENLRLHPAAVLKRMEKVKENLGEREERELKSLKVKTVSGTASFVDSHRITISSPRNKKTHDIEADAFIIAAGSVPIFPEGIKPDGKRIFAPRLMSNFQKIPRSIIMVGGGVTGTEFIYMFNQLGSQVTAVTDVSQILPRVDPDVSETLEQILSERGIVFYKNSPVRQVINRGESVAVIWENGKTLEAESAFIAIGRRPDIQNLHLERAGVHLTESAQLVVNQYCQTNIPHIYAAGDVTGVPMMANRAAAQGRMAAQHIFHSTNNDFTTKIIIEAVYTEPEVAQVGKTESEADREFGQQIQVLKGRYSDIWKNVISGHEEGFLKVILHRGSGKILGAAAVGYHAADLLMPLAVALRADMTYRVLLDVVPANPALTELVTALSQERV